MVGTGQGFAYRNGHANPPTQAPLPAQEQLDGFDREVSMIQSSPSSSTRPRPDTPVTAPELPALREELQRQRDFRTEQLAQLDAHDDTRTTPVEHSPRAADGDAARALEEIRALVAAGARQALADIELALTRMDDGSYGRCRACDAPIPLAVLTAIPTTTSCLTCHPAPPERSSVC
jgi:RNA polymerase-binding transcription factor DksA